jgi:alkylation response protein AidB-like acyl-CoA dehydrogenase
MRTDGQIGADLEAHQIEFRNTLRQFLERRAPTDVVYRCDREERYPHEIVAGLAELGVWGAGIGPEYNGSGAGAVTMAIACEEMQRAGGCIASAITPTITFCAPGIERFGTEEQKRELLPRIAAGELRMAIGLSEPDAGSDLSRVAMRARPADGGFVVSGTKVWCTGADVADNIFALVRTDQHAPGYAGLSVLLLPARAEGVTMRKIPKLASQGTPSSEVFVDDLWVSEDQLVGELNGGAKLVLALLDDERVFAAAQCVGMAQGVLDFTLAYARERHQFGQPIIEHQAIAHTVADMATDVTMARLLAYSVAGKVDAGQAYSLEAAMAKVACSEIASSVAQRGMQVVGSYSYAVEYPIERYYRETKLFEIAGGTNQILRNVIAKRLGGS